MTGYIGRPLAPLAVKKKLDFMAMAGQTLFPTGGHIAGSIDVFLNGLKLVDGIGFDASDGENVNLTTAASDGDALEIIIYSPYNPEATGDFSEGLYISGATRNALNASRLGSNGRIVEFTREGELKGSLDTLSDSLRLDTPSLSDVTLDIKANSLRSDSPLEDLGAATAPFKDVYLSDSMRLTSTRGTDITDITDIFAYETNIWDFTLPSRFAGLTVDHSRYTRIGNLVHCVARFSGDFSSLENSLVSFALPIGVFSNNNYVYPGSGVLCSTFPIGSMVNLRHDLEDVEFGRFRGVDYNSITSDDYLTINFTVID